TGVGPLELRRLLSARRRFWRKDNHRPGVTLICRKTEFTTDSPLEEAGFEFLVPLGSVPLRARGVVPGNHMVTQGGSLRCGTNGPNSSPSSGESIRGWPLELLRSGEIPLLDIGPAFLALETVLWRGLRLPDGRTFAP